MRIQRLKIGGSPLLVLLLRVFLCALLLLLATSSVVYAKTFVGPSTLTIDGTFTDWGTTGSPTSGCYPILDATNTGDHDGTGFAGKAADINYFWTAISTASGGDTPASPTNLIQDLYYRFDAHYDKSIGGQSYYIILNLGVANSGYADHLLQFYVDGTATPVVSIVLSQYDTPYPKILDFATSGFTAVVANIAGYGVLDTNASGALGIYDGTNYGIEASIPIGWYSSTYGGAVTNDGTGASLTIGTTCTGTGSLGSVGNIKDTLNDAGNKSNRTATSMTTGETTAASFEIDQIVFTTAAQNITVGQVSSIMTIQTQDALGIPEDVTADTTVNLTSTSGTGRFDTDPGGAFDGTITSITITSGTNSASFYYKDTTVGTPTITAAESPAADPDWTDATQQETITAVVPSISNIPSTWAFGTVNANSSYETGITYVLDSSGFRLTNNSAFNVNITISATNMTGGVTPWTLSDTATPGTDTYGLKAGTSDTGDYTITVTSSGVSLKDGLLATSSIDWGLQLLAPTSFSDGALKSGTVTLTATQA